MWPGLAPPPCVEGRREDAAREEAGGDVSVECGL